MTSQELDPLHQAMRLRWIEERLKQVAAVIAEWANGELDAECAVWAIDTLSGEALLEVLKGELPLRVGRPV